MHAVDPDAMVEAARGGDPAARSAFVTAHFDQVWRYAHALTHDPVAAEDVAQDTFLAALTAAAGPTGSDAVPWLLTIARNRWARMHRRRSGEPAAHEPLGDLGVAAGWGLDSERAAIAAQDRDRVQAALATLAPEDREVLWLRDGNGLDGPAAAALLGVTLDAMKSRLHRARLRLMQALREGGDDGHRS